MRSVEDVYFHVLTALLLLTLFAGGKFDAGNPVMVFGASIAMALLLAVLAGFAWMWKHSEDRRALLTPIAYFLMQSGLTVLGIYQTSLYLYCLTMHYVEYHVLMVPRCFKTPLDSSSRTDQIFKRLRSNRVLFYGLVLVIAGMATYLTWITMGWLLHKNWSDWPAPYRVLLACFDGLFVFHYFIEALIWKFGNPFYRTTLGPLYFAPVVRGGRPRTSRDDVGRGAGGDLHKLPAPRDDVADLVFSGEGEVALSMTESLLQHLGATPEQIDRERARIRSELFHDLADRGSSRDGRPSSEEKSGPTEPPPISSDRP